MKKEIFILIVAIILSFGLGFGCANLPVAFGASTSYENAMKSEKPSVVLFYANWCTYCQRFLPKFDAVSKTDKDKYNFVKIDIESSIKNAQLSNEYNVRSLPTVYIVDNAKHTKKVLSPYAFQTIEGFQLELRRYYNKR